MPDPIIGIDLGTTYSCVACWDDKLDRAEVIPGPSGRTTPSWVSFTPSGKLVGSPAKSRVASNPKNTVYDVKRIIGRPYVDPVVSREGGNFPFELAEGSRGEPRIRVGWRGGTRDLSPEEISAMVLSELRSAAERRLGVKVERAVITVPAHFNNQQRQATKDAGRIAGLDVRRIINEPTAAALAYGLHTKRAGDGAAAAASDDEGEGEEVKSNVVIFDLGGGTFDVSVLAMDGGVLEVRATGGDTHLGGEDFDDAVVEWCLAHIESEHGKKVAESVRCSSRARSRLRREAESAKRSLSAARSAALEVDSLTDELDFTATLTRSTFEELNSALFAKCIDTVSSVLTDAGITVDDVTDVVLVGGSTRVPILQSRLRDLFKGRIELCRSVHPDEAVAIGAAVQGHILATGGTGGGKDLGGGEAGSTDLLLLDVTPLSLGIELEGRAMSTLIRRNTPIPCRKTRTYTTVENYQTEIDVVVYEGERPHIDANNRLGSFAVTGVQRARAGEPKVDVTFALDANGILNVTARDQVTGSEAGATIRAEGGRLSPEDIDRMIEDAERYRARDEELARKAEVRGSLEEALYTAQSRASESGNAGDIGELEDMMDWLELDSESATLEEMRERGRILEEKFGVSVVSP